MRPLPGRVFHQSSIDQLQAFVRKAIKFQYANPDTNLLDVMDKQDNRLFESVISNPQHCLFPLLPSARHTTYNLRKMGHGFTLPNVKDTRNFINRCLFKYK